MERRRIEPSILEANFFYLFIGVLFITLGSLAQAREIYTGLLITEYLIILFPTILYSRLRKYDIRRIFRLNKLSLKQAILIPLIVFFSYPVGVFLNYIVITILSAFDKVKPNQVPIPQNSMELVISLFVISLSAGICEEVMFRGLIMKAYERLGIKKAIVLSALLFGLFHLNIQNFMGPAFLGVLFGYIVYKTDSIFSSMIAHTTNNAIALVLGIIVLKIESIANPNTESVKEVALQAAESIPETYILLIGFIFVGIIAIAAGSIALLLLRALPKSEKKMDYDDYIEINDEKAETYPIVSTVPIVLFLIIFIYVAYKTLTM